MTEQKTRAHGCYTFPGCLPHIALAVDHKQGVDVTEDLVIHRDAIQVLLQKHPQLLVLLAQTMLLLVQGQFVQHDLVVALPEVLEARALMHYLQKQCGMHRNILCFSR